MFKMKNRLPDEKRVDGVTEISGPVERLVEEAAWRRGERYPRRKERKRSVARLGRNVIDWKRRVGVMSIP
jgi:hypothetical protein